MQQEGYDAHDFNLFDDRSSVLWRKPYVDGAVRELTAGDSRSQEQIRQAVEQIMLAAGEGQPDVRYTTRKARRARGNVRVEAQIDMTWSLPRRAHNFFARAGGGRQEPAARRRCRFRRPARLRSRQDSGRLRDAGGTKPAGLHGVDGGSGAFMQEGVAGRERTDGLLAAVGYWL